MRRTGCAKCDTILRLRFLARYSYGFSSYSLTKIQELRLELRRARQGVRFLLVDMGGRVGVEPQQSMAEEAPSAYDEIGRSLAQPVAEGLKPIRWAIELAKLMGYTTADVKAWVKHYSEIHAQELDRMERTRMRKLRKVKRWQRKAQALKGFGSTP